jgi:hypothetical protein
MMSDGIEHSDLAGAPLRRRGLFGAGAALATGGAITLAGASPARAATEEGAARRRDTPVTSTLATAPRPGYDYRHVSWLDFQPESGPATRVYGGRGAYSSGTSPYMWATVEIPAGAILRDLEWYVYNDSGATVTGLGRLWAAGTGTLFSTVGDVSVGSGSATQRVRIEVPAATRGPHPTGVKLALGLNTAGTAGTVQINGVRVGLTGGESTVALLPKAVEILDAKFNNGQVRTLVLPPALVPVGATGVLLNVTATKGDGAGTVTVYSPSGGKPGPTLSYPRKGLSVANAIAVPVSSQRNVAIKVTRKARVRLDLIGSFS